MKKNDVHNSDNQSQTITSENNKTGLNNNSSASSTSSSNSKQKRAMKENGVKQDVEIEMTRSTSSGMENNSQTTSKLTFCDND